MPEPLAPEPGTALVPAVPERGGTLIAGLEWVYDRVSASLPQSATGVATDAEIDLWIRLACLGAGGAGFVANLGGVFTLPVALPANLAGTAAIQLALVSRIAAARGHDLASPAVRTFAIASLVGVKAAEVVSGAGVRIGTRLAETAVRQVSGAALSRINQAVGFRLLTKAGQAGLVNLAKFVPLAGGVVGGTIDAASTFAVGQAAKRLFPRTLPALLPDESPSPTSAGPD